MPIGIVKPEMLNNKTNFGYEETPEFQPFEFYSPQRFYSSLKYTEDEKKTHLQSCLVSINTARQFLKPIIELRELEIVAESQKYDNWEEIFQIYSSLVGIIKDFQNHMTIGIFTAEYIKSSMSAFLEKLRTPDEDFKYFLTKKGFNPINNEYALRRIKSLGEKEYNFQLKIEKEELHEEIISMIRIQYGGLNVRLINLITSEAFYTNEMRTTHFVVSTDVYSLLTCYNHGLLKSQFIEQTNTITSEMKVKILKEFFSELYETSEQIKEYIENLEFQKIIPAEPEIKNKELSMDSDAIKLKLQKYSDLDIYSHPFFKAIPYNPGCQLAFCRAFVSNMITNFDDTQIFFSMEKGHFAKFIRDCRIRNWPLVDEFICLNSVKFPSDVQHTTAGQDYAHSIGKVIFPEKYLQ